MVDFLHLYFCRQFSSDLVDLDFSRFTVEQLENTQKETKQTNIKQTDNSNINKIKTKKKENTNNKKKSNNDNNKIIIRQKKRKTAFLLFEV